MNREGKNMAKVSIIIPIYNVEKYVRKTIDSAINQTEKDIEIILVDDGSTDMSGKICDEYAQKDKRIKVIHKVNGGLSSARNAGIKVANSEYIMLLDGDDFLNVHAVSILNKTITKYPSDFVQFHYQEVRATETVYNTKVEEKIFKAQTLKELYDNLYRIGGEAASACTKVYRRDLLKENPFQNIQHEDEMWCTDAFKENMTVTYIPNVLYYYVMRENSIIHSAFNLRKLDIFKVIDERIKTLEKNHLDKYIHIEYEKMFLSIVSLYCQTKQKSERDLLKEIYEKNKNQISVNVLFHGKFKLLERLMRTRFCFINIYKLYWKCKIKK
jgi:glycosyltransferase involved in cell wall biosynthesis